MGNNNLATLFIDESGKSSLADAESEPFLLTGAILENKEIQTIEGFFTYIKRRFSIPLGKSFHSYDIYENPKTKLQDSDLIMLSNSLAEFISLIPIQIHLVLINKIEFKSALGIKSNDDFKGSTERREMRNYPYRVMASFLFAMFGKYLEKTNSVGQIIADSRRGADHQLLKTLNLCKEGAIPFKEDYVRSIKENLTALCFAEKGFLSGGLEVTDLISFVAFTRYKRLLSQQINGLVTIWDKVKDKAKENKITQESIRKFFRMKQDEVHKYLKR